MNQTSDTDPYYSGELEHLLTGSVDTVRHQLSISPIPKLPTLILEKLKPVSVLIKYKDLLHYRASHQLLTEVLQCLNQLPDSKLKQAKHPSTYALCTALEAHLKEPPCFSKPSKKLPK